MPFSTFDAGQFDYDRSFDNVESPIENDSLMVEVEPGLSHFLKQPIRYERPEMRLMHAVFDDALKLIFMRDAPRHLMRDVREAVLWLCDRDPEAFLTDESGNRIHPVKVGVNEDGTAKYAVRICGKKDKPVENIFSFIFICETFGLDPDAVRKAVYLKRVAIQNGKEEANETATRRPQSGGRQTIDRSHHHNRELS